MILLRQRIYVDPVQMDSRIEDTENREKIEWVEKSFNRYNVTEE
jgi:hypothetical protein